MTSRTSFDKSITSSPPEKHRRQEREINRDVNETRRRASLPKSQESGHDQSQSSESLQDKKKQDLEKSQNYRLLIENQLPQAKQVWESLEHREENHIILQKQANSAQKKLEDKRTKRDDLKTQFDTISGQKQKFDEYRNEIRDLKDNLGDLNKRKGDLKKEMDNIDGKIETITSILKGNSTVKKLESIPECNGILNKKEKENIELYNFIIKDANDFYEATSYKNVRNDIFDVDKDVETHISTINLKRKSYERFVGKLPEVTSLYNESPSEDSLYKITQSIFIKQETFNHVIERKIQIKEIDPSSDSAIYNKLAEHFSNLRLLDQGYCEKQKESLETFIQSVRNLEGNPTLGNKKKELNKIYKTTQKNMNELCSHYLVHKNPDGTFNENNAPGFFAIEKLYKEYRGSLEPNQALQNADEAVKRISKRITLLNINSEVIESKKSKLKEIVKSDIEECLNADKQWFTLRKTFSREMKHFRKHYQDAEAVAKDKIEEYKTRLTSPLHEKKAKFKEEFDNLQNQISDVEKELNAIRRHPPKNTKNIENQISQAQKEYNTAEQEVIQAERNFKEAARAVEENFDPNLKHQIDQARVQYGKLQQQLEQAKSEEAHAKMVYDLATNPYTGPAIAVFDRSSSTESDPEKTDKELPSQPRSDHSSGKASNTDLETQPDPREPSQKSSINELRQLLQSIQQRPLTDSENNTQEQGSQQSLIDELRSTLQSVQEHRKNGL